ncbi:hypothetical protein OESDEN_00115 [Oesophagostomum dentatum]|uniref:WD domain, G-beta repeat protein n=1 Tax=Oesophagostomum dentatum TaxID=61180 RepID=A0A0B1TWS2_OESDE|nr:hypothetical protein OESDEN_00115 [Oesophagostomum dentatum]
MPNIPCPVPAATTLVSSSRISSLTLNRPADLFASTSTDDGFVTIGTTDPETGAFGESTAELNCSKRPLCALFMDDERTRQSLVLVGSSSGIHIVDAQSGAIFRYLTGKGGATSLYSWLGCMVAAGETRGGVTLWDARVDEPVAHFSTNSLNPKRSVFAVDGSARVLALAGESGMVHLYDIGARKEIVEKKICPTEVKVMSFSPKMRLLLAADVQRLRIVNLSDITVSTFPPPAQNILNLQSVTGMLWDPTTCRFVARGTDKLLRLYRPDDADSEGS